MCNGCLWRPCIKNECGLLAQVAQYLINCLTCSFLHVHRRVRSGIWDRKWRSTTSCLITAVLQRPAGNQWHGERGKVERQVATDKSRCLVILQHDGNLFRSRWREGGKRERHKIQGLVSCLWEPEREPGATRVRPKEESERQGRSVFVCVG